MKKLTILFILFFFLQSFADHELDDLILGLQSFLVLKGVPEVQRNRIANNAKAYTSIEDSTNAINSDDSIFPKYKKLSIFYLNNISKVANQAEIFSLASKDFDTASSQGLRNFLSARAISKEDLDKVVISYDLGGVEEAIYVAQTLGDIISTLTNEYFKLMGEGDLI